MPDRPRLSPEAAKRAHTIEHHHLVRIPVFAALWLAGTALSLAAASIGGAALLLLPFSIVLAAASLHGISLFTHEGVHGVLFRSRWANDLLASACAWPVLQNFHGYRVLHLRHHADLGAKSDPDHYANYTRWGWGIFLMNWGRLLLGYPAYVALIPVLGFKHGTTFDRLGLLAELTAVALFVTSLFFLPFAAVLYGWLLPMVVINTLVNIRGMSQHTLLPEATHPVRGSRTFLVNPVIRFFMCNENFHLEHHLYPGVPWYQLPYVHQQLKPALLAQHAPFTNGYLRFVSNFVRESVVRGPFR